MWALFPTVKSDLARVREIISDNASSGSKRLDELLGDFVSRTGKMMRPAFLLLSARCNPRGLGGFRRKRGAPSGGTAPLEDRFYHLAAAVELLHMATLVHDDVVDASLKRRGRPTINALYGDRDAVLIGDFLFAKCFSIVANHATLKNAQAMAAAVTRICDGEVAEALEERGVIPSIRAYTRRVVSKTALLFALSFHVGADEAGAGELAVQSFRRAGYNVGVAFQIVDDILDMEGDPEVVGKTTGNDLAQGIVTLPILLALQRDESGLLRSEIQTTLAGASGAENVPRLVARFGGFQLARDWAESYTRRAIREVQRVPETPARGLIENVISELALRSY